MVHQRVWRRGKKEWEWEPGAMYDEWIRGHCYKEKTRGQRSAEEQPQHHIPQRISSQGIASWCSSNIPNEERRRKKKMSLRTLLNFISLRWADGGALAGRGRHSLLIWERASLPSNKENKKNGRKNHLQNRLRCRPYGSEFNKDKRHLLTAACSLGLSASPAFFFFFLLFVLSIPILPLFNSFTMYLSTSAPFPREVQPCRIRIKCKKFSVFSFWFIHNRL